jgi:hypothetical protein
MAKINPFTLLNIMRKYKVRRVYVSDQGVHLGYKPGAKMYTKTQVKRMIDETLE